MKPVPSIVSFVALSAVAAPQNTLADQAKPASGWTVNYTETQCTAERQFAEAGRDIELSLTPALNGASYEVVVSEGNAAPQIPQQIAAKVSLAGRTVKTWALNYRNAEKDRKTYRVRVPASAVAESTGGQISFEAGGFRTTLDSANLSGALSALATCMNDLRSYWNVASKKALLPAKAERSVSDLLKPANHDDADMWGGLKGNARYVLFIDATGNLAGCEAVSDDASPVLGVLGCDILRHYGQFRPARDESGAPVRSVLTTENVRWRVG